MSDAPECPKCGEALAVVNHPWLGPYSGYVRCGCGYTEGKKMWLAKRLFVLEPMPTGGLPIYDNEKE